MALSGEPIIILGSYRSGTSSVSTALVELGLYMGDEQSLFPADEFNPDGHWELNDMMVAHERMFNAFKSTYYAPAWLPDNWAAMPFSKRMIQDLRDLLTKHFVGKNNWGWKEPATSILLPLYKRALYEEQVRPRYLICVRHPKSVVASMLKRFVYTPMESWSNVSQDQPGVEERLMSMWVSYMLSSLRETKGSPRQLLCYERYLYDPSSYINRIADRLLPWAPSQEQKEAAIATVKPQLSHSSFREGEGLEGWPDIVAKVYDCCLRADQDPDGLDAGRFDDEIERLDEEWRRSRWMVQPAAPPPSQLLFTWASGQSSASQGFPYVPSGGWQVVSCSLLAGPGEIFTVDPYHGPCRMWISGAAWRLEGREVPALIEAGPGGLIEDLGEVRRLSVFGPQALVVRFPDGVNSGTLEMNVLVQSNEAILANMMAVAWRQRAQGPALGSKTG